MEKTRYEKKGGANHKKPTFFLHWQAYVSAYNSIFKSR